MKRDMDLCRKILFEIEKLPLVTGWHNIKIEEYSEEELSYHILLLHEAGLVEAKNLSGGNTISWRPQRLTWHGHEFLDAARDNERWDKAKSVMSKAGGFALDIMKQLLVQYMKTEIGLA